MHPADVEKLFQYLQGLKTYYGWSQSQWSEIETGFHLLRQRSRDTKLYLGIVGEFTTGKSTFINALLGLDVLKEDVLAGTTCAPTMICYGEKFDVEIHQKTTNFIVRYSESKGFFKRILFSIKEKLGIAELKVYLANGEVVSRTICTAEEIYKARISEANGKIVHVDRWNELIWKLEDFKFSKIENRSHDSYAIDKILSTFISDWKTDGFVIELEHIELLEKCLNGLSTFCNQLETSPEKVYHWLLLENHLGYTDERSMILPMALCQLFEIPEILRAITDLEGLIEENFDIEEHAFIKKYWRDRLKVKDKMVQLAIYVSMCRVLDTSALDENYNKFGYWNTPNDELANESIAVWCDPDAPYVFRSLSKGAVRMRHDSIKDLLNCHKIDKSIEDKMEQYISTNIDSLS